MVVSFARPIVWGGASTNFIQFEVEGKFTGNFKFFLVFVWFFGFLVSALANFQLVTGLVSSRHGRRLDMASIR